MELSGCTGDGYDCEARTRWDVSTAGQAETAGRGSVTRFAPPLYMLAGIISIFITTQYNYIVTSAVSSSPTSDQSVTSTWQSSPKILSCKGISLHNFNARVEICAMAKGMAMGQNFSFLAAWGMLVLCMAGSGVAAGRQLLEHKHTHNVTFFVHEAINTGSDATGYIVAGPGGETSELKLGALVVVDNVITETASPKSKQLGKFQGLYVLDGGQKYRAQVTVIIDQPGDLIETTYEVKY
jgi:hypothetical protein